MNFTDPRNPKRLCIKCKKSKPIRGGTTKAYGKGFTCKECKEKKG